MTNQRKLDDSEVKSFDDMVMIVLSNYALATRYDRLYDLGYYWYNVAHNDSMTLWSAIQPVKSFTPKDVMDTVAIISPALPWSKNIEDAQSTLVASALHSTLIDRKAYCMDQGVQTPYGYANHIKAWSILDGLNLFVLKPTCYKTWNFGQCLESPDHSLSVCIDQHIVHILIDDKRQGSISINARQYKVFAKVITHCAELLGMLPSRLQAILWVYRQYTLGYMVD